jgi:hypothetical protein
LGREGLVDRLGARQIVKVAARDVLRDGGPPGGFLVLVEELCVKNKVFPFSLKTSKKNFIHPPVSSGPSQQNSRRAAGTLAAGRPGQAW